MNILHLSDLHYDGDNRVIDSVLPQIVDSINKSSKKVDFILFTGDLVQSGSNKSHFTAARQTLFDYLHKELNVPTENVIFCSGNHDVDRQSIHPGVAPYFEKNIKSAKDLDNFYCKKDILYKDSLKPLQQFNDFISSYHIVNDSNTIDDLFSIHYREYNGEIVAFVCLSTSWLSAVWDINGNNDYGNLYFPPKIINDISIKLHKQVSKKILLMHHPIGFFRSDNAYELENILYDNFDMIFMGHVHKMMNVVRYNGSNGIYEHVSKATLTKGDNIGCSLVENIDAEDYRFLINEITYVKDSNECHWGKTFEIEIPVGEEKKEQLRLRKKIHELIPVEIQNANNLLLIKDDSEKDFLTSFNSPYIKTQKEDSINSSIAAVVPMEDLYTASGISIIYGKDKCGKTSLLRKLQLEYLINFSTYQRIPLYLDAKVENSKIDDNYSFENILRNYLRVNKSLTQSIIDSDRLVLLIDNFKAKDGFSVCLRSFIQTHDNCTVFITAEDNLNNSLDIEGLDYLKDRTFCRIYFHDLRRQEIIKYTDTQLSSAEKKTEIQDRIINLCKQMELPYNYWTISLLLLIHHKSSDTYSKNLFAILDLCVDEIFGKKKILVEGANVSFDQLKTICASLAAFLFENHESTIYSATKDEILEFLASEIKTNIRITHKPEDFFDFFVACGMLKIANDRRYVFRLNGFFEYFLAYHMTKDTAFKRRIVSDDIKYLGFKNQLEIYSGFRNDDAEMLQLVYTKTINKCGPLFNGYDSDKDKQLLISADIPKQLEEKCKELSVTTSLTPIKKAEIEDLADGVAELKSEVHLMQLYDPNSNSTEVIDRYLSILARVFKSIDTIKDTSVDTIQIFKTIVDLYCDYGFYMIDSFAGIAEKEMIEERIEFMSDNEELKLLKLLSNFSPIITQMQLFDGLGHYSLVRLIEDEIDKMKNQPIGNQYRLFILYFTLFDISLCDYYQLIDEAIENTGKIPLLKYMMLLKLNYYLAFKSDGNKLLEQFLTNRIQKVKLLLDNKIVANDLQKGLSQSKKTAMINNN